MISELLDEFLIDFAILGFSFFGYLLNPYARRLLAAGKVRLGPVGAWLPLWGFWARLVDRPVWLWTGLSRWRLSRAQLRLLELGIEIERSNLAARSSREDDDRGELRLEPGLVAELVQVYASSKLPSRRSALQMANGQELPMLDLEFVSRDDPLIRTLNWIDVDLMCFEPSARGNYVNDGRPGSFAGKLVLGGATEADSEQVRPISDSANAAGDHRGGKKDDHDDCSDRLGLHGPVEQLASKGSIGKNNGDSSKATTATTIAKADMQASNEALNNSGRVPEGEPPSAGGLATPGAKRPPADTKAGPNDDEAAAAAAGAGAGDDGDDDDGDGRGPRRRRQSTALADEAESHFSVSHEEQLVHVRGVWGGTNRVLIMLQRQQQQQQQQHQTSGECNPSRRDVSKKEGTVFCLVKFYTNAELLAHNRRATLIFYLIQLHSQRLVQLFGLVSVLLERAGLLRASGFWCRASWPELEADGTSARDEGQALDDWLELIGWELDQDDQSGRLACGRQPMRPRPTTLMDRYALLLMIAAHLERERIGGSGGASGDQIGLASSLMGFLESFSAPHSELGDNDAEASGNFDMEGKASLVLVRNAHSKGASSGGEKNVRMEIEFVPSARRSGAPARAEIELAVLDPIGPVEEGQISLDELTSSGANLTANVTVWPEIRQLFADSLQHLRLATAPERQTTSSISTTTTTTTTSGTNTRPVLAGLARLAQRSRHERRRQLPDLSAQIAKLWIDSPRPVPICGTNQLRGLRDSGKQILSVVGDSEFARANTITPEGSLNQTRQTAGWRLRLKLALRHALQNKLGRSIFLLVVFVTIRLTLMHYLLGLQRDLMYEARDDFIALKRMVFPEGLRGLTEDEEEEEEDAGDGISILTREERRQRAEREARRRASYRPPTNEPRQSDTSQRAQENEADDGERNEKDNGHNHDHPAPIQRDATGPGGEVNQVMEALLTSLMSQALGGGGGANAGDFSKMNPEQLQELVRMLEGFGSDGDDGGDLDYDDIEDAELDKIMDQMQLNEDFGSDLATGNLGKLMGDAGLDGAEANIDSGVSENDDDGDNNHEFNGHNEDPIWARAGGQPTQSSGATTTSAQSEL